MNNRFRVSSTLPRKLEELGISPDTVLRQAGLPTGLFKLERILVSTEELFALYRGIAEASNDPAIGLKLGTEERVERYDPIKLAALSAKSFRDAIERSARYKQLTCPEKIRLLGRGDECAIKFVWLLAHRARASFARRRVLRMDSYAGTARYWTAVTSEESRVPTRARASRNV
jgi:hypothetical protein